MSTGVPEVWALVEAIRDACRRSGPRTVMEVCGTHTVALFRTGIKSLLPEELRLISGPGCPVCVTSQGYIDAACAAARLPGVTVCTYGDMMRVPGREGSLADQRAAGGRVVVVYSARDALRYAIAYPETNVVFLAVGFETTAPATAAVVKAAWAQEVDNFFVFPCHKRVIPAMAALLSGGEVSIDGFLCPGHVSVIIGADAYEPLCERFGKPCVVAGFEALQMLTGILRLAEQFAAGGAQVENAYSAAVSAAGNRVAWQFVEDVFLPGPAVWRAMGSIPESGLLLRPEYAALDAIRRFGLEPGPDYEPPGCRCGDVIQGKISPLECPLFGNPCSITNPIGPCMVSSEGTCAAHFKYGR